MKFKFIPSSNYSKKKRKIKFIIIHYTGMQSERASINRLTSKRSNVSAHYLINKKGDIINMVDEKNIAWHAGKSKWKNFVNLNEKSIGIELVNKGLQFGYETFSKKQISKLVSLCKILIKKYKLKSTDILGHSDIAPLRKKDPGEKFPWKILSKKKIGYWHLANKKKIKDYDLNKNNSRIFFLTTYIKSAIVILIKKSHHQKIQK